MKAPWSSLLLVLLVGAAACTTAPVEELQTSAAMVAETPAAPAAGLPGVENLDGHDVLPLIDEFNKHPEHVRLVILLSPG